MNLKPSDEYQAVLDQKAGRDAWERLAQKNLARAYNAIDGCVTPKSIADEHRDRATFYLAVLRAGLENFDLRGPSAVALCRAQGVERTLIDMRMISVKIDKDYWRAQEKFYKRKTNDLARIGTWDYWTEYDHE